MFFLVDHTCLTIRLGGGGGALGLSLGWSQACEAGRVWEGLGGFEGGEEGLKDCGSRKSRGLRPTSVIFWGASPSKGWTPSGGGGTSPRPRPVRRPRGPGPAMAWAPAALSSRAGDPAASFLLWFGGGGMKIGNRWVSLVDD